MKQVLVCLAPGTEEIEAITTINLLRRAEIKVTTASVTDEGKRCFEGAHGIELKADTALIDVADAPFDAIVLPGGLPGVEHFARSELLIEKIKQMHNESRIIAAICAAPAFVLVAHNLFPLGNMTGYPSLQDKIPQGQWVNRRVCFDERVNLLTSQGPGSSIDFALKLIDLLLGKDKAAEIAQQLVLPIGINNYSEQ